MEEKNRTPWERDHAVLARRAAAEGMVLLKNEGLLPLSPDTPVALLGGASVCTLKGGSGSGDVNERYSVGIAEGMEAAGFPIVDQDWLSDYASRYRDARTAWRDTILTEVREKGGNPFDAYAAHPFVLPEGRELTPADFCEADVVIYTIGRKAGEGKDRQLIRGDYYLSEREERELAFLCGAGMEVVLLLNTGGPVELTEICKKKQIRAILFMGQPGQEGGHAAADVLSGRVSPSGKLTSTWFMRYEDVPGANTFGNPYEAHYPETIFVGYRYVEAYRKKPLFLFGRGLSYTGFSFSQGEISVTEDKVLLSVDVKNTGSRLSGREVVQVYAACPGEGVNREYRKLVGFAKTSLLSPGEQERVKMEISPRELCFFSPKRHAYLLSAGRYTLWVGGSLETAFPVGTLLLEEETLWESTKELKDFLYTVAEEDGQIVFEEEPEVPEHIRTTVKELPALIFAPKPPKTMPAAEEAVPKEILSHDPKTLLPLLCGEMNAEGNVYGAAGAQVPGSAGETAGAFLKLFQIPPAVMADGPAGIRITKTYYRDPETGSVVGHEPLEGFEGGVLRREAPPEGAECCHQYCTAFPTGTLLAQTWDTSLMEEIGKAIALEMETYHIKIWLAPGMNIQRNPLCGRNFEYYSEDPYLTGRLAAAITRGVQKNGGAVCIKHFACNNQEDNRMGVNALICERALREIYLHGFEIAVKESAPRFVMSSYNLLNGIHTANSRDLLTTILREEWEFRGAVMTDWSTTTQGGASAWLCTAAGNDLIMPGAASDLSDMAEALEDGRLSAEAVYQCAARLYRVLQRL